MFPDTGDGAASGLNISLAFSTEESGNQAFLSSHNAFDGSNDPNTSVKEMGSIGSLLPGLESYANAGDEFNMEIQQSSTNTGSRSNLLALPGIGDGQRHGVLGGVEDTPMDDLPPTESNFDDMYVGSGGFGDDREEDLLHDVEIGEFDSWFT